MGTTRIPRHSQVFIRSTTYLDLDDLLDPIREREKNKLNSRLKRTSIKNFDRIYEKIKI